MFEAMITAAKGVLPAFKPGSLSFGQRGRYVRLTFTIFPPQPEDLRNVAKAEDL